MSAKPTSHRFGIDVGGPGAILAPGSTTQRPVNPHAGLTRINTETKRIEFYSDGWVTVRAGDGYYSTIEQTNTKLDATAQAVDSDKLDGHDSTYFARAAQVLTDVPVNAVFTDTQRPVVNSLTNDSVTSSLSANQGKVLKTLIDNINTILLSDDTALDELQELVNFIKQNKAELDSLNIGNIAGLDAALEGKLDNEAQAVDSNKLNGQLASYYEDIVGRLGWTPVQQGGGVGQSNEKIKIGYKPASDTLLLQVGTVDHGYHWPIKSNDSVLLAGKTSDFYAKSTQVLTDVPKGAVFTDTWRPVNNTVTSTSSTVSATANAARVAYNKGAEALDKANTKLDANATAVNSDLLAGQGPLFYAKASQVLTDVPAGAVFTDTQVVLSSAVNSASETTGANSKAVKTAFDKATSALITANTKLNYNEKAVDSALLDGKPSSHYAKSSQVLTNVPKGAVFTDTQRPISNVLTSTSTTTSLSANQGRVLKTLIDNLNAIVSTDDTALDELQEIVDFIKMNKAELGSLTIANIAGLQAALDNKLAIDSKAVDSDKLDGRDSTYFAKASQVLTDVPSGAVFTDTQRPVSDSVTTSSTTTSASLNAVKTAYDKGVEALNKANTKLTVGDPLGGSRGLTYWSDSYSVSVSAPKKLTDSSGAPLDPAKVYRIRANIKATGTNNGATAVVYNDGAWKVHHTHRRAEASNHVNIFIDGAGDPAISTWHGNSYEIYVWFETILGTGTTGKGRPEIFGTDGFLSDNLGELFYRSNKVFHANNGGSGSGFDADLLDGQHGAFYAKSSQVLTNVPKGAVFTDTQRPVSDSVASTSTSTSASSKAVKTAYDRGTSALNVANTKLGSSSTAVDSDKLDGQSSAYYAKASQVLTNVPKGAVFTDTNTHRPVSDSVVSASTTVAANSKAVKTAYDRGTSALNVANTKLGATETAVNSDKLGGQLPAHYAKASQVLTNVPANAKFTDTNTQRTVVDSLLSTRVDAALTANQGRVIKGLIDDIESILAVNDATLDEAQEVVNFLKASKKEIDGIQAALPGKLGKTAQAVDSAKLGGQLPAYYAKASQVKTNVPAGAKFTDTQRPVNDTLTSTSKTASLTANQGRVLKGLIDNLNAIVSTDDGTLDELQEIVNFIKQNKATLDSLTIANIAGLQSALNGKLNASSKAVDSAKLDGQSSAFYAKASQVLTNVPKGAVFTDTQRAISNSVTSTSSTVSASSNAVKAAYDRASQALSELSGIKTSGLTIDATGRVLKLGGSGKADSADLSIYMGNGTLGFDLLYRGTGGGNLNGFEIIAESTGKTGFNMLQSGIVDLPQIGATVAGQTIWHRGNDGSGSGLDADLLDGQHGAYYAKASQVLTNVPKGAVFTDTNTFRPISDSVASTSTSTSASSKAVKTAYDRGTSAINVANGKLDGTGTAVDSDKLAGQSSAFYAKASQVLTNVPAGAKFTDTQRPLSSSTTSTSATTAATSSAVKAAMDKANSAKSTADGKLASGGTAVNASKLNNKTDSQFIQTTGTQTATGVKTFSDGVSVGGGTLIKYDSSSDSIVFSFT